MKPLPIDVVLKHIIAPLYPNLLPSKLDTPESRVMLLAIGLQESRFTHRRQIGGPARGFWQFERGGGVRGVLNHPASKAMATAVCRELKVGCNAADVYRELDQSDLLSGAFARLLLYTDPAPLPAIGETQEAWALYERTWRPGQPHPEMWPDLYAQAALAVGHVPGGLT